MLKIHRMPLLVALACLVATPLWANENGETNAPRTTKAPLTARTTPIPHCEVPCGIYADQMRFERMLEDTETIAKAIASINEFTHSMGEDPPTAKSINQVTRWVSTKEDHATNTQHIVAQYFLTQRIKPDMERYEQNLKAAHAVMVAAMKCKQDAAPATAENLKKAIFDLYRAYEGKEPEFHEDEE